MSALHRLELSQVTRILIVLFAAESSVCKEIFTVIDLEIENVSIGWDVYQARGFMFRGDFGF